MSTPTFAELLTHHLLQTGISDSELARSIGVRRQTVFRWKEGLVERPRAREDVLRCAQKLRLTPAECDLLLLAAGFAPATFAPAPLRDQAGDATPPRPALPAAVDPALDAQPPATAEDDHDGRNDDEPTFAAAVGINYLPADSLSPTIVPSTVVPLSAGAPTAVTPSLPVPTPRRLSVDGLTTAWSTLATGALATWLSRRPRRWLWSGVVLGLLALLIGVMGLWWPDPSNPPSPTPTAAGVVKVTLNPPPLPVDYPVALPGETLLVVAPFADHADGEGYNVAGRIQEALSQEIDAAALVSITIVIWPEPVEKSSQVRQVVSIAGAAMVIWGEYDSGRVRVNWTIGDQITGLDKTEKMDFALTSPSELITIINTRLPQEIRMLALIAFGRLLRDQGDPNRAQAAFRRALELDPEDDKTRALLNFYLGHLSGKTPTLASFNRAISYYTEAIQYNAQLVDAYYNRGTIYLNRSYLLPVDDDMIGRDLDRAIADLNHVLTVRPNSLNGYLNRGVAYYERNQTEDMAHAVADFSRIIAVKPQDARAYFHRGLVYVRTNNTQAWVADFTKVLTLQPAYYDALNGLCWGYALDQQPELALPHCEQAAQLDPTGASRDSRGIVFALLGRDDEAIAEFAAYLAWIETLQPETLYARYRGPQVEAWITQLERGENPFTTTTLAALR